MATCKDCEATRQYAVEILGGIKALNEANSSTMEILRIALARLDYLETKVKRSETQSVNSTTHAWRDWMRRV